MGWGIIVAIFFIAFGAVMVVTPKGLWWFTESWKFRNPEANEPSDASYSLTRVGGVGTIILGLVVGGMTFARAGDVAEEQRAKKEEAAFVAPAPERRGRLPVIGFTAEQVPAGTAVDVYYLAPMAAVPQYIRTMSSGGRFTYPCTSVPTVTELADGRIDFSVELVWAPQTAADAKRSDACRTGGSQQMEHEDVGPLHSPLEAIVVHTDSPVWRQDRTEAAPAAAGNVVPRLDAEPNV